MEKSKESENPKIEAQKVENFEIDINYVNSMCALENQSYKTCLQIGERNFNNMKGSRFSEILNFFLVRDSFFSNNILRCYLHTVI